MTSTIKVDQIQNSSGTDTINQGDLVVVADQWRLESDHTTDSTVTDWHRVDDASFGYKEGMTLSNGVFSFPKTGLYNVSFFYKGNIISNDNIIMGLDVTINNSTYDRTAEANASAYNTRDQSSFGNALVNVTDISQVKCRLVTSSISSGSKIVGTTGKTITGVTFIRLCNSV